MEGYKYRRLGLIRVRGQTKQRASHSSSRRPKRFQARVPPQSSEDMVKVQLILLHQIQTRRKHSVRIRILASLEYHPLCHKVTVFRQENGLVLISDVFGDCFCAFDEVVGIGLFDAYRDEFRVVDNRHGEKLRDVFDESHQVLPDYSGLVIEAVAEHVVVVVGRVVGIEGIHEPKSSEGP